MKKYLSIVAAGCMAVACNNGDNAKTEKNQMEEVKEEKFVWSADKFGDIEVLRYQVPGWEKLTAKQRIYVYYLNEAGISGRDIMWDQNYRFNLEIRKALETIIKNYKGDKSTEDWLTFMTYAKRVFFSNGIHHHYANTKLIPAFSQDYFNSLLSDASAMLSTEAKEAMFSTQADLKKVNRAKGVDKILASAVNFYDAHLTQAEVEAFYKAKIDPKDTTPISYGLNSKLVKNEAGKLVELPYKVGGLYGTALEKVVANLTLAQQYAENEAQANALGLLIEYYNSGDLKKWDEYNIAWVNALDGDVDYINGFVEVYNDPLGYRGSYETIIEINDFDASARMKVVSDNVQWFEDNSPIMNNHKKTKVTGVTYKVVTVAGEAGDATRSTPIGVNLPNANWIRQNHGSKSVSLGNLENAYHEASGEGFLKEFAFDSQEIERAKKYGTLGSKMHTALHEVVGHASGKINDGVGTPKETLKEYASTLEEARADLVALYYVIDPKMIEIGLLEDDGAAKAEYDSYIRNGMMTQLYRINPGEDIEEDHMRNRQLVASWAFEKGLKENVIEKKVVEGKTYFVINNYDKLRVIFGQLLTEIQRIKSEGDYNAGQELVENYGVKVDGDLHAEVLRRVKPLNIAPYRGFVNPILTPKTEGDSIIDVEVTYPTDFIEQMLYYGENYSFLK